MGSIGTETQREIRMIDLSDFEQRKYEIADQLWSAAIEIGFFQVYNHGISSRDIDHAFKMAERSDRIKDQNIDQEDPEASPGGSQRIIPLDQLRVF